MHTSVDTQVLIAGAGPVGLTAAIELARRGVDCRIVDSLPESPQYAKAVGLQPRALEVFEAMGVLRQIVDASTQMKGKIVYVDGERVAQMDLTLPVAGTSVFVVGYLGYSAHGVEADALVRHLCNTFR